MVIQDSIADLELLAEFLNTWHIDNDDRSERDDLVPWAAERAIGDREALKVLRNELRLAVEQPDSLDNQANDWIRRYRLGVEVSGHKLRISHQASPIADLARAAIESIADNTFRRLKACPDCRWAFVDQTKNNSKRWCVMNSTDPKGRSCGNIAKARRHRQRRASLS